MRGIKEVILTGNDLTLEEMVAVARHGCKVRLSEEALKNIKDSRKIIDDIVENEKVIYGVTTGFGEFCNVNISKEDCKDLQENLIRSHACGFGPKFSKDVVRNVMLLRANALSKGFSGITIETLNTLINMLNEGVHPQIPEKGSLGASGDLAPLAHMVLPMLGLGEAEYKGEVMSGKEVMKRAGIPVIQLHAKEGLALINGTQVLTAVGALATYDAIQLLKVSDIAASITMEALRGITDAFDSRTHIVRPHEGQMATARNILNLIKDSTYVTRQAEIRVQDAYSLRCIPQIHGASKDAINYIQKKVEIEINSVTDNPIITKEGDVISGGNFHGQPMALSFDFLGIAVAEIANVSERRLERLINPQLNDFPAFLAKCGGLNSGFMINQYAAAALVSENKILAHPASVDSIPSSANQEDLVSMGTIAARTARDIVKNAERVVATEIMAACQAIDFRKEMGTYKLGKGTEIAYKTVREVLKFIETDGNVQMYEELDKITELITSEKLLNAVDQVVKLEY